MTIGSFAKSPTTIILPVISYITSVSYTELQVFSVDTQFLESPTQGNRTLDCNICFQSLVAWFYTVHIYTTQEQALVNFPMKKLV